MTHGQLDGLGGNASMAKCDEGYLCSVCGTDVESIIDSDLYLRYVIGEVDPETLHTQAERHIRCNPTLAQFIVDEEFESVEIDNAFRKQDLDEEFVRERERLVTRGWRRLRELHGSETPVTEYPLPEFCDKWR
jgi:hypothetical protein